jgi:hypothetical protein
VIRTTQSLLKQKLSRQKARESALWNFFEEFTLSSAMSTVSNSSSDSKTCGVCGLLTTLRCSDCKSEYYCGRVHQSSHWNVHKKDCKIAKFNNNINRLLNVLS